MPIPTPWDPHSRPIHKLILALDIFAIAWNRYRQLSFRLKDWNDPETGALNGRMSEDFGEMKLFSTGRMPGDVAKLADRCIAEAAPWCIADSEAAITEAAQWISDHVLASPRRYPAWREGPPEDPAQAGEWLRRNQQHEEEHKAFMSEGAFLFQARDHRGRLIRLLARHGESLPDAVADRIQLYFLPLVHDGEDEKVSQARLLSILDEASPPTASPTLASEPGQAFNLPGFDPSKGSFIIGLPSCIDRDSDLWESLSDESKAVVDRNDDACKIRNDLLQTPAGRLQLFLKDFRVGRMTMTAQGRIDPKRWKLEEACLKWWDEARWHRDQQPFGTLDPLPLIPETFENSARVQNALDALAGWAEDSLLRLPRPPEPKTELNRHRPKGESSGSRQAHDEADQREILRAWRQAGEAGILKAKFVGDYAKQHNTDRKRVKRLLEAALRRHRRRRRM